MGQIAADKVQAAFVKRIQKSSTINRDDIKIRHSHIHQPLEEGGSIHSLPFTQDQLRLIAIGHRQS